MAERSEYVDDLSQMMNILDNVEDRILYVIYQYTLDFLDKSFCPLSRAEIARAVGAPIKVVSAAMNNLISNKKIVSVGRCRWEMTEDDAKRLREIYLENVTIEIDFDKP